MNRSCRYLVIANQFAFDINIHMVLVAEKVLAILSGLAGSGIFLALLVFAPVLWRLSFFDGLVKS